MSAPLPKDEAAFWQAFESARGDACFAYEVNRPLAALTFLLLLALLVCATAATMVGAVSGVALVGVWVVTVLVVVAGLGLLFAWRTFARRSAVLIGDEALIWLDRGRVDHVPWRSIDETALGEALAGARRTEGRLVFAIDGSRRVLPVYNPYMRIAAFPALMAAILHRVRPAAPPRTDPDP